MYHSVSSPLSVFMDELRRQRSSDKVCIHFDNARTPYLPELPPAGVDSPSIPRPISTPPMREGSLWKKADRPYSPKGSNLSSGRRPIPMPPPVDTAKVAVSRWEGSPTISSKTIQKSDSWDSTAERPARRLSIERSTQRTLNSSFNSRQLPLSPAVGLAVPLPDYATSKQRVARRYASSSSTSTYSIPLVTSIPDETSRKIGENGLDSLNAPKRRASIEELDDEESSRSSMDSGTRDTQ